MKPSKSSARRHTTICQLRGRSLDSGYEQGEYKCMVDVVKYVFVCFVSTIFSVIFSVIDFSGIISSMYFVQMIEWPS